MKAILFAAGLGTRLKPFTNTTPKALTTIGGTTLLAHNLNYLERYGIFEIVINVHHFPEQIEQYLANNQNFGLEIVISDERNELLETGGGVLQAMPHLGVREPFLAMNADILTNININKLRESHQANHSLATLAVMQRPSGRQLLFNDAMVLCGWKNNKTNEQRMARQTEVVFPYAFTGVQIIDPSIWQFSRLTGKFSLIDLYLEVATEQLVRGYDHSGDIFLDVGKPESIELAENLINAI